ncbi:MAG: HAMP domain-containing histidine kinase [Gemmatimonadaceae bacterium]|nr:HAMP domain-containing histidine kinase [Gemmatimonadaceae bacterium]
MTSFRRFFARGPSTSSGRTPHVRSTGLFAVLLLALLATIALTAQAWLASRAQRRAAEEAVRDYARFAANNYAMESQRALRQSALAIFSWLGAKSSRLEADSLYDLAVLSDAAADVKGCKCMWDPQPLYFFRYVPSTNELKTIGPHTPSPMELDVLRDSIRGDPKTPLFAAPNVLRGAFYMVSFPDSLVGERILLLTALHGVRGAPDAIYGFASSLSSFSPRTFRAVGSMQLLPPSLTRGVKNDSLFAVKVFDDHRLVYESRYNGDTVYSARSPLWTGNVTTKAAVQVSILPNMASRLLIGGMPETRAPLLFAFCVLSCALLLSAFVITRRAQDLASIRDDFTSSVSHELRTPLAEIMVYAEMLQLGRVSAPDERSHAVSVIVREARHLTHLIDNVLLFSRASREQPTAPPANPLPLAPLVHELVRTFAPLARRQGISIHEELDEDLAASISAPVLRHALLNLLDNAAKYAPPSSVVTVRTSRHWEQVRICVDDRGEGVPTAERERIWEPYVRLPREVTSSSTGSGIGLSVVRHLVDRYRGRAWVEDAPEGGARFVIEVPGMTLPRTAEVDDGSFSIRSPVAQSGD